MSRRGAVLKLIQVVVATDAIRRVQEELNRVEVFRLTVSDVQTVTADSGGSKGLTFEGRPGVRLEIAVNESFV